MNVHFKLEQIDHRGESLGLVFFRESQLDSDKRDYGNEIAFKNVS